jgi:anti-sigma factor RsiW
MFVIEPCERHRGEPAPTNSDSVVASALWAAFLFGILLVAVLCGEVNQKEALAQKAYAAQAKVPPAITDAQTIHASSR